MKHLGDITKIDGYAVPVVDCVIGGSPCQDLSIAGKREGLAGARSGLFMEQIRLTKEMREACARANKPVRPRFFVWENVHGAFSSNKGEDFRAVLEEIARVVDKDAVIPRPAKWTDSGCIMGNGWSIAWRVHDAQFWTVPQRRVHVSVVADFAGGCAPEVLFVREGMCGDIAESGAEGQGTAEDAALGFGETGAGYWQHGIQTLRAEGENKPSRPSNVIVQDIANCLKAKANMSYREDSDTLVVQAACFKYKQGASARSIAYSEDTAPTLDADGGHPPAVAIDCRNHTSGEVSGTLQAKENGGQSLNYINPVLCRKVSFGEYVEDDIASAQKARDYKDAGDLVAEHHVVRRLTPLECERLQGFPDGWTDIGAWTDSKGKLHKESSDSARYKALGNSIALPFWKWLIKRISALYERDITMCSLFDGIGGFPYLWEQINGKGSCLWASEIEEFPMAVTRVRLGACECRECGQRVIRQEERK